MAPRRLEVTTTGVTPGPTCLLCGIVIPNTCNNGVANSDKHYQLLRESQWNSHWKSGPKHVMVPSNEVEEAYLSNFPRLWSCLCRAIIKKSDSKYRLTGINMVQNERSHPYYAPNDPAMARIGGKKTAKYHYSAFTKFYAAGIGRKPDLYRGKLIGYIIHAHCWVLFGRLLGPTVTEIKLAKLIRVSRKYWRNNELWELYDTNIHRIEPRQVLSEFTYDCDIYQNPLVVPEVQKAINCANIESQRLNSCFSKVPLEVAILIAEWVCPIKYTSGDIKNTRNMLCAFQWNLPNWFWLGRLDEGLFFELDMLKKASCPVDLQVLGLDLMGLVSNPTWYISSGLANRERVLRIMVAIKKAYLERA